MRLLATFVFTFLMMTGSALAAAPKGVLLDFTATWCGPCQKMSPLVSRLKREGYPIKKVDVDQEPELARRFNVSSIPAFVLVVDGKEVARSVGATTESNLRRMLARIPAAEPAQPERSQPRNPVVFASNDRRSNQAEEAPIQLAQDQKQPEKKSRGFNLPFFGKNKSEDDSVPVEEPVIRAQFGDAANDQFAEAAPQEEIINWRASTVRIRVKDKKGMDLGSGTVIHSAVGRTLIMTCSHIFSDIRADSVIEVDVFQGEKYDTYVGTLVRYNLEADVGLISIPTSGVVAAAKVAPLEDEVKAGDVVASLGCSSGELPTLEKIKVTELNRFLGPDNIECTGMPVQGRSGGGLFNRSGQLVGVCFAVDKEDRRGLYAGLPVVHKLLDESNLTALYKQPAVQESAPETKFAMSEAAPAAQVAPNQQLLDEFLNRAMPTNSQPRQQVTSATTGNPDLSQLQAALDQAGEAEVVCIIRPLNKPKSASRVVIINKASSKFVSYLSGEVSNQPQPTSARFQPAANLSGTPRNAVRRQRDERISRSLPRASKTQHLVASPAQSEDAMFRPPSSFTQTAKKSTPDSLQNSAPVQRYRRSAESRR
ncbi:thioredoxin fold domain-containing protein [Gimesia chilikensis]|uniref:thioredoxin domain-containing protein n=1 Tax=Gimesia chilikensis TaxID=2605989 RepID=UPI0011EF6061|nr:thioredoxin domain-containing protein [Gimesia chilikensis]KAA0138274.1 thioredoxin fold domain-containing protein [Gimesia chilikensis]